MLMKDKICLVTGATDGIGKETARCLGKQNAQLILVGRNPEKGEKVRKKLIEKTGNNAAMAFLKLHKNRVKTN